MLLQSDIPMTRADFVLFVENLRADFRANKDKWTNTNIDDYLKAVARYAQDLQGY